MYIFSVTFVVEPQAEEQWRDFFSGAIRPIVGSRSLTLCRVLSEHHEGHFTFSLQIEIEDMVEYGEAKGEIFTAVEQAGFCNNEVLCFDTLLRRERI